MCLPNLLLSCGELVRCVDQQKGAGPMRMMFAETHSEREQEHSTDMEVYRVVPVFDSGRLRLSRCLARGCDVAGRRRPDRWVGHGDVGGTGAVEQTDGIARSGKDPAGPGGRGGVTVAYNLCRASFSGHLSRAVLNEGAGGKGIPALERADQIWGSGWGASSRMACSCVSGPSICMSRPICNGPRSTGAKPKTSTTARNWCLASVSSTE